MTNPVKRFTERLSGRPADPIPRSEQPLPASPLLAGVRSAYEPFGVKDKIISLDVRCAHGDLDAVIPYHLLGVVLFRRSNDGVFFTAGGIAVTIRGRNLQELKDAFRLRTVDFVQEFSAEAFQLPQPVDPLAAFIDSIEIEPLQGPPQDFLQG